MGYPDFQRLSTRTAALLTDVTWTSGNETESSIVDVSAFANVTVIASIAGDAPASCAIQWLSSTGTGPAKVAQYFTVHPSIANDLVLRTPVLMPYAQLFANTTKGATSGTLDLLADNGPAGPRTIPETTGYDFGVHTVAASGALELYPDQYYSGPATVAFYTPVANLVYVMFTYDDTLTQVAFSALQTIVDGWNVTTVNLPASAWWVQFTNTSAMSESMALRISV